MVDIGLQEVILSTVTVCVEPKMFIMQSYFLFVFVGGMQFFGIRTFSALDSFNIFLQKNSKNNIPFFLCIKQKK